MIYDGHAYCIPDLNGDVGFDDPDQFRRHLQLAIAQHFQPSLRKNDRAVADSSGIADPAGGWSFDALKDAGFHAARHGRFEWTVGDQQYFKQYMPPSVVDMSYSPDNLVAEMDYAGVDMALLHRTPYLGIGNDFIAECVYRFPDRLQGLAHVEEWLIQTEPDISIKKLEEAISDKGLSGLQFLPDNLPLYGQNEDWDSSGYRPFWDAVARLNIPLFITPGTFSLVAKGGGSEFETFLYSLRIIRRWMERYPDVKVVLTHGFSWRMFIETDTLRVPEEVFQAAPIDNPNFYVQLLFAIFLGGVWDYPMPQISSTLEVMARRIGADRLIWGTDMPMVMRFYTYRQNLEYIRSYCDFLSPKEMDMILGGSVAKLMGVKSNVQE